MFNRRRITVALIGLIVLVIAGWLIKNAVAEGSTESGSREIGVRSLVGGPGGSPSHHQDRYESYLDEPVNAEFVDAELHEAGSFDAENSRR